MTTTAALQEQAKALAKRQGIPITRAKELVAAAAAAEVDLELAELCVISYGGGVDSTAILLRCFELGFEEVLGFAADRVVVLMAQTGNEYADLADLIEAHIFPRMAAHGVRFVQVARVNSTTQSEYVVLDDSRAPERLHLAGRYQLREEMVAAGTLPQSGGTRLCSIKSKGWPLDAWQREHLGGRPFAHVVGFESAELGRVLKDVFASDISGRLPRYPLVEWGWDRARCLAYIREQVGVCWVKSACYFCPFAGQGVEREALAERWAAYPELAADALLMEYVAQALNETQTLFGGRRRGQRWDGGSAIRFVTDRGLEGVLEAYEEALGSVVWGLYRVRRVWSSASVASRCLEVVARGSRAAMRAELERVGGEVERCGPGHEIERVVVAGKGGSFPCAEDMWVVAPARAADKAAKGFETRWEALEGAAALAGDDTASEGQICDYACG